MSNDPEKRNIEQESIYTNCYSSYRPFFASSGFKNQQARFSNRTEYSKVTYDFLINLGMIRGDVEAEQSIQSYLDNTGIWMLLHNQIEDNFNFKKIKLKQTISLNMSFHKVMQLRRSRRQFTGDGVPFAYVSSLLNYAYGVTEKRKFTFDDDHETNLNLRTVPSAGGIYPVDIYLVALNVIGVKKGFYQFNPIQSVLVQLGDAELSKKILNCFSVTNDQIAIDRSGFILLLSGTAQKSICKYGMNGLVFLIHEIGSISQNIHLATAAMGLGSVDCASFYKNECHELLNFDGSYKHLFHSIVVGSI